MIYKVLYQESQNVNPKRETTKTLYLEADSIVAARQLIENNTPYNVELIEELTGNSLEFEQKEPNYKLTEFSTK